MSQPTPYTPTTDFSAEEASNTGGRSTVRTAALDAELANIETTLDQTLANLALIQRDDGKLKDGLVEIFNLSATAKAALGVDATIEALAADIGNINLVAADLANVDIVATHATDVSTLAPHAANVSLVAPHVANLDSVAGDLTNINAVATDITNVDKVAVSAANINTVAADLTNIDTVATNIGTINTVATGVQGSTAMNNQFLADNGVAYWHWYHTKKSTVPLAWADYNLSGQVYSDTALATEQTTHGGVVAGARVNYTGYFDADWPNLTGSAWNNANSTDWTAANFDATQRAANKLVPTTTVGVVHAIQKTTATRQVGVTYRAEYVASPSGYTKGLLQIASGATVTFDMTGAGSITSSVGVLSPAISKNATTGNYTITCERVATATSETIALTVLDGTGASSFTGDGTSGHNFVSLRCLEKTFNHAINATAGAQPTLYIDTLNGITRKGLLFDGVNDFLKVANFDISRCTGKVTLVMALTQLRVGSTTSGIIVEHGTNASSRGIAAHFNNSVSGAFGGTMGNGPGGNIKVNNGPTQGSTRDLVATIVYDPAGSTADDRVRIRIGSAEVDETNTTNTGTASTDAFTCQDLYFGMRAGASLPENYILRAWALYGETAADTEISAYESTGNLRNGNVATTAAAYSLTPVLFSASGPTIQQSDYLETSPFGTVDVLTAATSMTIGWRASMFTSFPLLSVLGVYVNGVYNQTITAASNGLQSSTITLPAGDKLVTLANGPQTSGPNPFGNYIQSVTANRTMQAVFPSYRKIVFLVDSIGVGQGATTPMDSSWSMGLRQDMWPATAIFDGWGSDSLFRICQNAAAIKAFVKRLEQIGNVSDLYYQRSTNDYGLGLWTDAATFGTQFAALMDAVHTRFPALKQWVQTAAPRNGETDTGHGALSAYRTQQTNIVAARSTWAIPPTLLDGTTIWSTATDLNADGVHPNDSGHTKMRTFVKTNVLAWV